jgi:hypothetical protein
VIVIVLTAVNIAGVKFGTGTQNWLTIVEVLGLLAVAVAGLIVAPAAAAVAVPGSTDPRQPAFGLCMVFVLLTYGGWNEAAYISAELKDVRRNMLRALVWSMFILTVLYLLVNLAYLRGLGLAGMARSQVVAADLLQQAWGSAGAQLISVMIAVSALTSINAPSSSARAATTPWAATGRCSARQLNARTGLPTQALLVRGPWVLALSRSARSCARASRLWDFTRRCSGHFLLTGLSLQRAGANRSMRGRSVPLYPLLPLAFCASSAWLAVFQPGLYASRCAGGRGCSPPVCRCLPGAAPGFRTTPATRPHVREQDDVADARAVGEQHDQPVYAYALPGRRRQAVFERADVIGVVVHGLFVACFLLLCLLGEARRLVLRIVQLGKAVGHLAPGDVQLEAVGDRGVRVVAARERGDDRRVVHDVCRLDQQLLGGFLEEGQLQLAQLGAVARFDPELRQLAREDVAAGEIGFGEAGMVLAHCLGDG